MDYVLGRMTGARGSVPLDRGCRQRGRGREILRLVPGRSHRGCWARIEPKTFCYVYDVTQQGNWEEHNILNLPGTIDQAAKLLGRDQGELEAELAAGRAILLAARESACRRPWTPRSSFPGTA